MTRPDPRPLGPTLRRHVRGAFTERLLYKGAAVFLALVLWLVVSTEQPTQDTFPVRLLLQMDSTLVLTEEPPQVNALVVGQLRDIFKLGVNPPELRVPIGSDGGDGADSVRVTLDPGDVQLPVGMDRRIDVRGLSPAQVTFHFTTRVQRRVPVRSRVRVTADSGLRIVGQVRVVPDSVTVIGTREAVQGVTEVPTMTGTIQVRDTSGVLVMLDTAGLGVQVQPSQVRLRVPVLRDSLSIAPLFLPWGSSQVGTARDGRPEEE
ncbi:MAG TPA: hypothetical protein VFX39_08160 [Gemmatimonadaceae bacterium]|nr:hypothetical protein [Gemmatimonadaceae bacterium]